MDPKDLINWSELSRQITKGGRNGIRPSKVPVKHHRKVARLIKIIGLWQKWAEI